MSVLPKYIPLSIAAEAADVSERTIRRRIAEGALTAYRIGPRAIRLREDEVAAWLAGGAA